MAEVSEAQNNNNLVAAFLEQLRQIGVVPSPDIQNWVAHGIQQGWSTSFLMKEFRKTRAYQEAFPHIPRGMSESQYVASFRSLQQKAQDSGVHLSKELFGTALKNRNSPNEIGVKLDAIKQLKTNKALFQQFDDELAQTGHKNIDRKNMLKFIMGKGSLEWERVWNTASAAAALEQVGIGVGKGEDISFKNLRKVSGNIDQLDTSTISALASAMVPEGMLRANGISKKTLAKAALGGVRPGVQQKIKDVLNQHLAYQEDRANPNVINRVQQARSEAVEGTE